MDQQLQTQYVPTRIERFKVTKPGSVLIVRKDGIGAIPAPTSLVPYANSYKDGRIKHAMSGLLLHNVATVRDLQIGEKLYLLKMELKESSIVFQLQTCGACDPSAFDPTYVPLKASISFQFGKGFQDSTDYNQIQQTIGQVLTVAADPNASQQPAQQAPPQQITEQQPTPQSPPPAQQPPQQQEPTANIDLGQSTEQVLAALGQPDKIVRLGSKEIYVYKNLKVTFVSGKVSDVE